MQPEKKKKEANPGNEILACMICLSKIVNAHMCPHCTKLSCEACIKDWLTDKKH
jgi:tripartite motif-containing protein 37